MCQLAVSFPPDRIEALKQAIETGQRFAIVCHMSPDGDALGSSLCLWHVLKAMGKEAAVITPDAFPASLAFLPGANRVTVASYGYERANAILRKCDTVFCLDFNELARLDKFAQYVERTRARFVLIDHHTFPQDFADITFSYPGKSSTCSLLFSVLAACGLLGYMDVDAATCCCAGMMTDTGNFSYNSADPDLYRILAWLVERGVDKDALYKKIFDTSCEGRIRLMGYCQYRNMMMVPEHRLAVITLSLEESREFGYQKGYTEALVNVPLGMPEVVWSVYLREVSENYVKVSMRSKGDFSVRDICSEHFGGGGHHNAAGGEMYSSLDATLQKVLDVAALYHDKLPEQ